MHLQSEKLFVFYQFYLKSKRIFSIDSKPQDLILGLQYLGSGGLVVPERRKQKCSRVCVNTVDLLCW